ncbi:DUF4139 domain-containing protein [uncultured Chryseobacterium sp.]|uniref:DUF4139 domain-containing protein n=1 Tax=uncultured Chryseobacterium sp. TaxID=259322 RepID=UPI0025DA2F5D|nr:DUF4139 domain-containing protein [uncultured Chryseobacterium sp.]
MREKIFLFFVFLSILCNAQKPIITKAKINAVNVYRTSGELQHSVNLSIPSGVSEIIITNVSDQIDERTIQINPNNKNISVLSAQYTTDYISEYNADKTNPAVKKVTDSINIVEELIAKADIEQDTSMKTIELLDKNQTVLVGSNAPSVAQLIQLTDYYKSKRTELNNTLASIRKKTEQLKTKLARLKKNLTTGPGKEESSSDGVIILKLLSNGTVNTKMDISYIAEEVSWNPFYEIRGNKLTEPLDVVIKARINQDTGIDWKGVKLSLINGRPSRKNTAPVLNPWFLNSYKPDERPAGQVYGTKSDTISQERNIEEVVVVGFTSKENQFNTSFDVNIPYDILSNSEDHIVNLKQMEIPAEYQYTSVPKYGKDVFLIAKIKDYIKHNLIEAPANIIFENMYVGETFIKPNQIKDELDVTLGDDKRISVYREMIKDKSNVKLFSSYQEKTFTYDISVRNNKKEGINIEIMDQVPLSKDEAVKIELLESSNAKVDEEKGFLTWKIKMASGETKKFRISYKVRYPKDYSIGNLN